MIFFFIPKKAENYKNLNMSLQLKLEFEIFFLDLSILIDANYSKIHYWHKKDRKLYQVYEKIDQFFYLATKIMENEKKINMHTKYLQFMN